MLQMTRATQGAFFKNLWETQVAEWEVRKALAGHSSKNVEEIQRMMPDDFNRKLKEWEIMKATTTTATTATAGGGEAVQHRQQQQQQQQQKQHRGSAGRQPG